MALEPRGRYGCFSLLTSDLATSESGDATTVSSPRKDAATSVPVKLKGGGDSELTLQNVAVAALHIPASEASRYAVLAVVADRLVPTHLLVREALGGRELENTNRSEMALRELGFRIMVARRYDKRSGMPIALTREQINASEE